MCVRVRRLSNGSLTALFQLQTIRAYGKQRAFMAVNYSSLDKNQMAYFLNGARAVRESRYESR